MNNIENFFNIIIHDKSKTSTYLDGKTLLIDKLLLSKELKMNIIFHEIWWFFFKTRPSMERYQSWYNANKNNDIDLISLLRSSEFELANSILHLYEKTLLETAITKAIENSRDKQYCKRFIIEKLCWYYDHEYDPSLSSKNVFLIYRDMSNGYVQKAIEPNYNPITDCYLVEPEYTMSIEENVFQDMHFIYKLIKNTVICIEDAGVTLSLVEALVKTLVDKQRPIIVLNVSGLTIPQNFRKWCIVINTERRYYDLIPSVCEHFILISTKKYPSLKSLAVSKENSIYYLNTYAPEDIDINDINMKLYDQYDRYVTTCPVGFTALTPKKRVFRIFEPLDINILSDSSCPTIRVLVGTTTTQSTLDTRLESCDPEKTKQITIYTPGNKNIQYHIVIDEYNEIPTRQLYVYLLVDNTKVYAGNRSMFPKTICNHILFSTLMFEKLWKDQMKGNINKMIFNEFFISYAEKNMTDVTQLMALNRKCDNIIVTIDNRPNPFTALATLFTLKNVDRDQWNINIYTSDDSKQYYMRMLNARCGSHVDTIDALNTEAFNIDTYNDILKSSEFWNGLSRYKKVLIIQDDGMLLRSGIERYLEYDYVGAPWVDEAGNRFIKDNINSELVGNGGFSLRDMYLSKMVTEKYIKEKNILFYENKVAIPEDVYFVKHLKEEGANIADNKEAQGFSCEQVLTRDTLGFHKPWGYHHHQDLEAFLDSFIVKKN